jgi:benzoate 4-monooxygenase
MAHAFSLQSIKEMEPLIDKHVKLLRENLDQAADSGVVVDLKELIAYYVLDVLGDLAFSQSFDSQKIKDENKLPPINDHIYLACLLGQMPELLPYLKKICAYTPLPWFQRLFAARRKLVELTANCVRRRLDEKSAGRKDLLSCLIDAVDPDTGARLTELDINTEAFAMV